MPEATQARRLTRRRECRSHVYIFVKGFSQALSLPDLKRSRKRQAVGMKRAKCLEGRHASLIAAPGTGSPCVAALAGLPIGPNSG